MATKTSLRHWRWEQAENRTDESITACGDSLSSSSTSLAENEFGAYLGFKQRFWQQYSRDIITCYTSPPQTVKTHICTTWKSGSWESVGNCSRLITPWHTRDCWIMKQHIVKLPSRTTILVSESFWDSYDVNINGDDAQTDVSDEQFITYMAISSKSTQTI